MILSSCKDAKLAEGKILKSNISEAGLSAGQRGWRYNIGKSIVEVKTTWSMGVQRFPHQI